MSNFKANALRYTWNRCETLRAPGSPSSAVARGASCGNGDRWPSGYPAPAAPDQPERGPTATRFGFEDTVVSFSMIGFKGVSVRLATARRSRDPAPRRSHRLPTRRSRRRCCATRQRRRARRRPAAKHGLADRLQHALHCQLRATRTCRSSWSKRTKKLGKSSRSVARRPCQR